MPRTYVVPASIAPHSSSAMPWTSIARREELGTLDEQRRKRVEQAAHFFLFLSILFLLRWPFLLSFFSSILFLRFLWTAPI
jgi:hypothetical protein